MYSPQAIADLLLRVYEIHEYIVAKTGGLEGLRDATMLRFGLLRTNTTIVMSAEK